MSIPDREFPIPELAYMYGRNFKRYVIAYVLSNYPGWRPVQIRGNKVLCRWEEIRREEKLDVGGKAGRQGDGPQSQH